MLARASCTRRWSPGPCPFVDTNGNPERHPNAVSDSDRDDDTDSLADIGDPERHALYHRLAHGHLSEYAAVLVSPGHLSALRLDRTH